MNTRATLVTTGLAAALALAPVATAQAAPKPAVNFDGSGPYRLTGGDMALATGSTSGTPFDGRFRAALQPLDGTLPEPGVCEPGRAVVRIDGPGSRYAVLAGAAEICGQHTDGTNVVTQVFSSTYDVVSTSERKLRGGDGWMEIRLTVDGRAVVSAFDS
jgi:hypothetical protein